MLNLDSNYLCELVALKRSLQDCSFIRRNYKNTVLAIENEISKKIDFENINEFASIKARKAKL